MTVWEFAHLDEINVCWLCDGRSNAKLPERIRATWQNSTTVYQRDRRGEKKHWNMLKYLGFDVPF